MGGVKPGQVYRYKHQKLYLILSIQFHNIKDDSFRINFLFDGKIGSWIITSEAIDYINVFEGHTGWQHVL